MIASKSLPAGRVPYSRPPSPPRREAQKASATAGAPWRTSSEPCSASAMPSTTRRARVSSVTGSENWRSSFLHVLVQARVGALGLLDLVHEHLQSARGAHQRAQHVEAHHVARALPDRGERRLAVQARHTRLLDIAVAAEALQGLERVVGGALAYPVLADGGGQALEQVRVVQIALALSRRPRRRLRRRRAPGASPARWRPRTRCTGRPARCASAAGRSTACQTPSGMRHGGWRCTTPARMPAAPPITQSSRVWPTISMIVGTPRPGSPTIRAHAPWNSTSLEALEWLPSLSFKRWM